VGEREKEELEMGRKEKYRKLSDELFTISLEHNRYLIYAPLRQAAFVGNATFLMRCAKLFASTPCFSHKIYYLEKSHSAVAAGRQCLYIFAAGLPAGGR